MNKIFATDRIAALVMTSLIFAGFTFAFLSTPATAQSTVNVTIDNYSFSPPSLVVVIGINSSVTWTNQQSGIVHTVTANDSSWGSGNLTTGQTYSHTFNTAGTFSYHCSNHPYMHAIIKVEGASSTQTASGTSGGGIPEFPLAPVALVALTAIVLASYVITRRSLVHQHSTGDS